MTDLDGGRDVVARVCLGALLGAAAAYFCFTDSGGRLLDRLDGSLNGALERIQRLQTATEKIRYAVDEGRRTLHAVEHMTDPIEADHDWVRH